MTDGDVEVPAGFELVADETRARILLALAQRRGDRPDDPALGFAELRRRAGVRDSGNFNYHLDKLHGRFVEDAPDGDGYVLSYPGSVVVAALVSGEHDRSGTFGPEPYTDPCPVCGAVLEVTYEDGVLALECAAGDAHSMAYSLPPHAVDGRDLPAAADLMARRAYAETGLLVDGRCPLCFGVIDLEPVPLPAPTSHGFDAACSRCGMHYSLTVGHATSHHPAIVGFLGEQGVDLRSSPTELLRLGLGDHVEQVGDDPPRYRIAIERRDGRLVATVDGDGSVVATERE